MTRPLFDRSIWLLRGRASLPALVAALYVLLLGPGTALAQVEAGRTLYNTYCAGCHGSNPALSSPRLAANRPEVLANALNLVSAMNFLRNVPLTEANIRAITDYIGSVVANPVVGPALELSPASVDFAAVAVGTTSAARRVVVRSVGSASVTLSPAQTTGAEWRVADSTCTPGFALFPGAGCTIDVSFSPAEPGLRSGALGLSGAGGLAWTVPLVGLGVSTAPVVATGTVVEYYASEIDQYFYTADPAEQAFVDSGGAGRWSRTGLGFAAGGSVGVCRFYGNTLTDPQSGRMYGPASHFYTADAAECEALRGTYRPDERSWRFESFDFLTSVRLSGGGCPLGTVAVRRAYNDGFARGRDSNHRLSTDPAAIAERVARGWIDEGVVMCAPAR